MVTPGAGDRDAAARPSRPVHPLLAALAMFSGAALLLNVLGGISLRVSLATGLSVVAVGLALTLGRSDAPERRRIVRGIGCGALAGALATMTYDLTKAGLSLVDPSPYNPFHVIRVFGQLLAGRTASDRAIVATGAAFHLLNGTMFGVAYTFVFGRDGAVGLRHAIATGIGWGIFLELFQLTLYPGWLDIRTYAEFATISALGHVVYGATLGAIARTLLRFSGTRAPA